MILHIDDSRDFLVIDECSQQEYEQLQISLNIYSRNYRFSPSFKRGVWDGKISFIRNKFIPATLYKYLFEICERFGFECTITNLEEMFDQDLNFDDFEDWVNKFFENNQIIKPRYYQTRCAFNLLKNRKCMANMATSSGKTLIIFIVFAYLFTHNLAKKVCMVVPRVDLCLQTRQDFLDYDADNKLNLSIQEIFSGCRIKPDANVFIGTYQSLVKECPEYFQQFDCEVVDECHTATSASLIKIQQMVKCPYRIGVSGTIPNTTYADGLTLLANFGPIVDEIKAKQLQDEGYISNCKITQVRLNYTNDKQKEALKNAQKQLRSAGKGKDMFQLENKFVNESEKRFHIITKLISGTDKNTMVLFKERDYGKKLYTWLKENTNKMIYYIDGDIDKKVREEIRKRMEIKDDVVLVCSFGTSSTGISINKIFNIFFVSSYKSISTILQSIGRGLRKSDKIGKDFVNIYDISDDLYSGCYEMAHARERIKIYENQTFPYEIKKLKM